VTGERPGKAGRPRPAVQGTSNEHLRVIEVAGDPFEMGRQHGRAERDRIIELVTMCASTFGGSAGHLADLADVLPHVDGWWGAEEREELRGIAVGSGVSEANIMALNLWLYPDIDAGCAHFII